MGGKDFWGDGRDLMLIVSEDTRFHRAMNMAVPAPFQLSPCAHAQPYSVPSALLSKAAINPDQDKEEVRWNVVCGSRSLLKDRSLAPSWLCFPISQIRSLMETSRANERA